MFIYIYIYTYTYICMSVSPLSTKLGTYERATARFCPWLSASSQ